MFFYSIADFFLWNTSCVCMCACMHHSTIENKHREKSSWKSNLVAKPIFDSVLMNLFIIRRKKRNRTICLNQLNRNTKREKDRETEQQQIRGEEFFLFKSSFVHSPMCLWNWNFKKVKSKCIHIQTVWLVFECKICVSERVVYSVFCHSFSSVPPCKRLNSEFDVNVKMNRII